MMTKQKAVRIVTLTFVLSMIISSYIMVITNYSFRVNINNSSIDTPRSQSTILIPDQVNTFTLGVSYSIAAGIGGHMFQTFTPESSPLGAVDLLLREGGNFPNEGYTTILNIRELESSGSIFGPILGTSSVFIPGPGETGKQLTVQFLFLDPIILIPGQVYVIEWFMPIEGAIYLSWMGAFENPYPYGTAYNHIGNPWIGDVDFCFTTYTLYIIPEVITSTINIEPNTINLKSKGRWITVYIELPEEYYVGDIDLTTVILQDLIPAESTPTNIGDFDGDGILDLMVKFDRESFQSLLTVQDSMEISISGYLTDGTQFVGTDTIRVIDSGKEHIDNGDPSSIIE